MEPPVMMAPDWVGLAALITAALAWPAAICGVVEVRKWGTSRFALLTIGFAAASVAAVLAIAAPLLGSLITAPDGQIRLIALTLLISEMLNNGTVACLGMLPAVVALTILFRTRRKPAG